MKIRNIKTIPFLHLDFIKIDHQLMRQLPPEVAYRYQALPIATDGRQITIAIFQWMI
ncbi:MAG: hypothetical protein WBB69_11220 [Anaerolineales bacterium]